jgi:hypothetical protein
MKNIIIITLLLILSSCATQKRCERKFGEFGVIENKVDTLYLIKNVEIPKVEVNTIKEVYTLHDTISVTDSTDLINLRVWFNKELQRCEGSAQIIRDSIKVQVPIYKESKTKSVTKHKIPFYIYLLIGSLVIILILVLIKR